MTFDAFTDRLGELNWLAVVVGAVVFLAIGWIWYGPLFGKRWSQATGIPMESGSPDPKKVVSTLVYSFVLAAAVHYFSVFEGLDADFENAIVTALLLGVFVVGAATYSSVVWERRKTEVWLIDLAYAFVSIIVVNYVMALIV